MLIEKTKSEKEKEVRTKKEFICPKCNKPVIVEGNEQAICPFCSNQNLKKLLNENKEG